MSDYVSVKPASNLPPEAVAKHEAINASIKRVYLKTGVRFVFNKDGNVVPDKPRKYDQQQTVQSRRLILDYFYEEMCERVPEYGARVKTPKKKHLRLSPAYRPGKHPERFGKKSNAEIDRENKYLKELEEKIRVDKNGAFVDGKCEGCPNNGGTKCNLGSINPCVRL